jgi:flagella basal body P-ring formation protein FlgA
MNKDDTICYTGIGSVKTGNHTRKKFVEVMNKNFKKECSVHIKSLKCKSCKKSKEMNSKEINKQLNAHLKNKTYKMTKNTENKIVKQMNQCKKCKNNKTKKCNFDNYILFSGAELGECEKNSSPVQHMVKKPESI